MKKHWIALAAGAAAVAVGGALLLGPRLPALAPPVTIHSGSKVETLTLSPDGRLLADDAPSGQVLLYDTATGQQSYALAVRTDRMVFSPDGRHLLTQSMRGTPSNPNGNVQVWDTATGAQLSQFLLPVGPEGAPDMAALSRDLRWAVVRGGAGDTVYDVATGTVVKSLSLPSGKSQAAFSPDRRLLAVSSGAAETLRVWDTKTWRPIPMPTSPVSGVTGIRFSPDGSRLALGRRSGLAWWDTRTWRPQGSFALPTPSGLSRGVFYFSSDSRSLLLSQVDTTIVLHQVDCATGRDAMAVPSQMLQHVTLTGDRAETWVMPGKYQLLLYRDSYSIWDTAHRKPLYQITIPPTAGPSLMGDFQVRSNDLSADGHTFAVGGHDDGVIRVWRLP